MQLLLAVLPYCAAVAVYWQTASSLFSESRTTVPSNWNWRLVFPVAVGGLTPLALAAKSGLDSDERGLLLSVPGVSIIFSVVFMGALWGTARYYWAREPIHFLRRWRSAPRWLAVVATGSMVLVYGATTNVIVANQGDQPCERQTVTLRAEGKLPRTAIVERHCVAGR